MFLEHDSRGYVEQLGNACVDSFKTIFPDCFIADKQEVPFITDPDK